MAQTNSQALLVLISAPSGAGKTTLFKNLLAARPEMARVVTCTTRAPRPGERERVDYYFLSVEAFEQRIKAGEFLEHARVYGNYYGTLKSEVFDKLRAGRDVLLNIDVQGAASVREQASMERELGHALVTIFLTTPSLAVLEARLRNRGTEAEAKVTERLQAARREIAQWEQFDYLLVSDTMEEDLRRMQVILEAEKMRQNRSQAPEY